MTRVAIVGGGISGLTAAYELELARRSGAPIDWQLYEASNRLGGVIETTRHTTPEGTYILEGGPDGWISEKPWARDLAIELGLESDLIYSNDAIRKTYIWQPEPDESGRPGGSGKLQPIPDRMRLMVPEDLTVLENSPLFTDSARAAYAAELAHATQLKSTSPFTDPTHDESVATIVLRHFGEEVLTKLAAPLLSGVFGGDVHKLSARAVMPQFIALEREHGSLIAALQAKAGARGNQPAQPIFTSFRNGIGSLTSALVASLPTNRIHLNATAQEIACDEGEWTVRFAVAGETHRPAFPASGSLSARPVGKTHPSEVLDHILLATSLDQTRRLLFELDPVTTAFLPSGGSAPALLPTEASSAVLATFTWPADLARTFTVPSGFGFLVPPSAPTTTLSSRPERSAVERPAVPHARTRIDPQLLACTFVDQKFPHRAPPGARILRAFFGGPSAEALASQPDEAIAAAALAQLRTILGRIPDPTYSEVRRLPRSLPQYEVGHLDRMLHLDALIERTAGLHLLGNSYRGVGLPDLIHAAREAARRIARTAFGH